MSNKSAFTFITIDQVVRSSLKNRPIIDYQAEAARIARYYGAGILTESHNLYQHFTGTHVDARNWPEDPDITEDAELISIETVIPQ